MTKIFSAVLNYLKVDTSFVFSNFKEFYYAQKFSYIRKLLIVIKNTALIGHGILILMGNVSLASDALVTVRVSTQWPLANASNLTFLHFKQRVEAESKGGIHVEIYDAATLYGDSEVAEAISSGAVEMGFVSLSRYAPIIPAADVFQLPFLFNTEAIAAAARVPGSEMRQLIDGAILAQARSRVLWWVPQGSVVFLSNTASVADPQSLIGKTVRTFGPTMEAIVRECGGKPKDIDAQEQGRSYETHLVDIGMTGIKIVMERKLWRFMNIVTRTNHASVEGVAVVNEKFWQQLSESNKEIISAAAIAADKEAADLLAEVEATAYTQLVQNYGTKIFDLSEDNLLRWRICSSDVLTNFVEKSGDLEQKMILAYGRLRQQPCCDKPTRGPAAIRK